VVPAISTQKDRVMITIANWVANLFILGLGLLFLGGGLIIILGIVFSFKDMYDRR
jgi:hypothetical protein